MKYFFLIILLGCNHAKIKEPEAGICRMESEAYILMNNLISKGQILDNNFLHEETLDIQSFRSDSGLMEILSSFFETSDTDFLEIEFSGQGNWCSSYLKESTLRDRNEAKNFISFPVFNKKKNKAFIIGYQNNGLRSGYSYLLLAEKKEEWNVVETQILSLE